MPKKEEASKKHFQTSVELFQSAVCVGDMKRVKELFAVTGLYDAAIDEKGATGLIGAAMFGQSEVVLFLLPKLSQAQIAASDYMGNTAVMFAAQHGYIEIVMQLLLYLDSKEIVQTNRYNESALLRAARMGHSNLIQLFLKKLNILQISENGIIALIDAIWNGYADIVKLLIEAGITEAQILTPYKSGTSPLLYAIDRGNSEILALLFSIVKPPSLHNRKRAYEVLLKAIEQGNSETITLILPHINEDHLNQGDIDRNPFLSAAVERNQEKTVKLLLEAGLIPWVQHCHFYHEWLDGVIETCPALVHAAQKGYTAIVALLIPHLTSKQIGAHMIGSHHFPDEDQCCSEYLDGATALMAASENGQIEIVKMLLNAGLTREKILHENDNFKTALDVAATDEIKQMIQNRINELSAGGTT